jgi:hypothetical protein
MLGMGRECGIPSDSPSWSRRSKVPASNLAAHDEALRLTAALQEIGERMDHAVFPEPGHGGARPGRM